MAFKPWTVPLAALLVLLSALPSDASTSNAPADVPAAPAVPLPGALHLQALVPAGHALHGAFVDGRLVLGSVPLASPEAGVSAPGTNVRRMDSDCYVTAPGAASWVSWDYDGTNNAHAFGECHHVIHRVPILAFTFTSASWAGSGEGTAGAYDPDGYIQMTCRDATAGDGHLCDVWLEGTPPPQFVAWESGVWNMRQSGMTFIEWQT
jgi:hypothetical protein